MTDFTSGDIASAAAALSSDAPPASAPASSDPSPVPATTRPAATQPNPSDSEATEPGPLPFKDHKRILDGAYSERDAARREIAALRERFGWAEAVQPDQVQTWRHMYQLANERPVEFLQWFQQQVASDPRYAAATTGRPAPDLVTEDGRKVYSADQAERLLAWSTAQLEAKLDARIAPFEHSSRLQQASERAQREASEQIAEARTWHAFDELRPQILKAMQEDGRRTLRSAYTHVYNTVYVPTFQTKVREEVYGNLRAKQAASTIHPGSGPVTATATKAPTAFTSDLLRQRWQEMKDR